MLQPVAIDDLPSPLPIAGHRVEELRLRDIVYERLEAKPRLRGRWSEAEVMGARMLEPPLGRRFRLFVVRKATFDGP